MDFENDNLYDSSAFGLRVAVIPAGNFENEAGQTINYDRGIKLVTGKRSIKITALQAVALIQMVSETAFQECIKSWASEEKAIYEAELKRLKGI